MAAKMRWKSLQSYLHPISRPMVWQDLPFWEINTEYPQVLILGGKDLWISKGVFDAIAAGESELFFTILATIVAKSGESKWDRFLANTRFWLRRVWPSPLYKFWLDPEHTSQSGTRLSDLFICLIWIFSEHLHKRRTILDLGKNLSFWNALEAKILKSSISPPEDWPPELTPFGLFPVYPKAIFPLNRACLVEHPPLKNEYEFHHNELS